MTVTHEQLYAELKAVQDDVGEIKGELAEGNRTFAALRDTLSRLDTTLKQFQRFDDDKESRLRALEKTEAQRDGREGVFSAIARSPIGIAIAGVIAAVSAYFYGHGSN